MWHSCKFASSRPSSKTVSESVRRRFGTADNKRPVTTRERVEGKINAVK